MSRRVSLTKSERSSGIGAELLALCQTVTDDGYLSKDEINELRRWLKDNRDTDLPAIAFLHETLERILADRRITREERQELYQAIELVLPPDARREAIDARREAESEREYRDRMKKDSERAAEREAAVKTAPKKKAARVLSRPKSRPTPQRDGSDKQHTNGSGANSKTAPLASSKFMVAGVHHEGRDALIEQFAVEGDQVFLARDPASPLSPNAIEVRLENGYTIGFVPEEDAQVIAPMLDEGCPHIATIKAIMEGGRVPVPVVVAKIYDPEADIDDLVFQDEVPTRESRFSEFMQAAWQSQIGWFVVLGVVLAIAGAAYFLVVKK